MEFLKQWVHIISIIIVISNVLIILVPSGRKGIFKAVLTLFILVSVIIPFKNNSGAIRLPSFDLSQYEEDENAIAYERIIENQVKGTLDAAGIKATSVSVKLSFRNNEITINEIKAFIPDEYDKDIVRNIIFDKLGYVAGVEYIGG